MSSFTEEISVWISVPADEDYECGSFNMSKLKIDINCSTYTGVGHEWRGQDGKVYRWLEVRTETGIVYGLLDVETLELKFFESIEKSDNPYESIESDEKIKVFELS